jgi:hypothetical protein
MIAEAGRPREVSTGKELLDSREKVRVDRQDVSDRAMLGAGLLDENSAIALEDVRLDLTDRLVP